MKAKPKNALIAWSVFVRGKYFAGTFERRADAVYSALCNFREYELKDKGVTFEKVAILPLSVYAEMIKDRK